VNNALVKVKNLKKYFTVEAGMFSKKKGYIHAVEDVNFEIYKRETLGLVGESGCGKTTLGRLIIRLLEPTEGEVYFEDKNIFKLKPEELRNLRKKMQIIFQDPDASLNPRMKVMDIISEPLTTQGVFSSRGKLERVKELMNIVALRETYMRRYPHQFSGGQKQRIGIARALALNPEFIVCDEPVSALDVSIRSQILNLLNKLQDKLNLTYLFISHDLSVIKHVSDRICVMFLGKIVELGTTEEIFKHQLHPYTKFLLSALPLPNPHLRDREQNILKGEIPSPINIPAGCRFHTQCPYAKPICKEEEPKLINYENHYAACHFVL
jgi:oligopeptide/dipeptide ABC transporter ATP-binding protein